MRMLLNTRRGGVGSRKELQQAAVGTLVRVAGQRLAEQAVDPGLWLPRHHLGVEEFERGLSHQISSKTFFTVYDVANFRPVVGSVNATAKVA